MALKPDRHVVTDDITFILNTASVAGKVVILKTTQPSGSASGVGIGVSAGIADVVSGTPASGTKPLGILLHEFVDIDQSVRHRNYQKVQQVLGEPCTILRNGWCVTDQVTGTPAAGDAAYLGADSKVTPTQVNNIPVVGQFLSIKDTNGFAKVYVTLA